MKKDKNMALLKKYTGLTGPEKRDLTDTKLKLKDIQDRYDSMKRDYEILLPEIKENDKLE